MMRALQALQTLQTLKVHVPGGGVRRPDSAKAASLRAAAWRLGFNLFPAFRGTGARVVHLEPDMRVVLVRLPFNWRTRNLVGTTFGGSMYAAVDPFYALMLMQGLGPGYVVWDKAASIRYRRPGLTTLYARFTLGEEELQSIRRELAAGGVNGRGSVDRVYTVELRDAAGEVHAAVEKTLYIRRREGREETRPGEREREPRESQEDLV